MHAITFICPPQVAQVSLSILNTRFSDEATIRWIVETEAG